MTENQQCTNKVFKLSELKPHPKNLMIYGSDNDETFSELVQSIKDDGLRTKIIVNDTGTIISGHRRFKALKELGYTEIECEVRHYENEMEELMDLVVCNVNRQQKTRVQHIREGDIIYDIEAQKVRQSSGSRNGLSSKMELRDIVAKIINWGMGAQHSGKNYSLGRSALREADRLRHLGQNDLADIIITQINKRGASAAYQVAFKVDMAKLDASTIEGLRAGHISGRSNNLPLKFTNQEEVRYPDKPIGVTKAEIEMTVDEYNAQSRGEIEIAIATMEKDYVSSAIESAIQDFQIKIAQCMTHQREIAHLDNREKARLNRIMSKFIEDFEKDKNIITGGI